MRELAKDQSVVRNYWDYISSTTFTLYTAVLLLHYRYCIVYCKGLCSILCSNQSNAVPTLFEFEQ